MINFLEDEKIQHIGTKHKVKINGFIGNRKLEWDKISPTITGRGGGTGGTVINVHPSGERRMTVREYARIQTFPDEFKFSGSISVFIYVSKILSNRNIVHCRVLYLHYV